MRILHIISSLSKTAGGPSRSVQGLVAGQCAAGIDAWLMTLKDLGSPWIDGIPNYRCAKCPGARGVKSAVKAVVNECKPDLVEIHSLWQTNLHQAVVAVREKGVPYILTPRGCIDAWSLRQKWLKKKIALMTYQGHDLKKAIAFHTTSDEESGQIRKLGYAQPIVQHPNGVNLPVVMPPKEGGRRLHRMLFLSRMHEKKGVKDLIRAWNAVRPDGWVCELVYTLASRHEAEYEREVKELAAQGGCPDKYDFIGAKSDEEKWKLYRNADCFILPTHTENFGIVVAEALYAGLPVITTKGAPWKDLETEECGWWVDEGSPDALARAIVEATGLSPSEREAMGTRGRSLVERKYSWNGICRDMKQDYERLLK